MFSRCNNAKLSVCFFIPVRALPGIWSDIHNLHWLYAVPDPSVWCQSWLDQARLDLDFLTVTESCPCTLAQALLDAGRFSPHPACNVDSPGSCELSKRGAVHCVRVDAPRLVQLVPELESQNSVEFSISLYRDDSCNYSSLSVAIPCKCL